MKFALFVVIAILFWNSDGARQFTAESFNTLADVVQPDNNYDRWVTKAGPLKRLSSISTTPNKKPTMSQKTSATIYRGLFTDGEWEVIDRALSEYVDHLDEDQIEEQNYYSLQAKIRAIFQLTA